MKIKGKLITLSGVTISSTLIGCALLKFKKAIQNMTIENSIPKGVVKMKPRVSAVTVM